MSTRVTTTILLILLVLVSAASGVYHLKSRQEVEALQQRITELTREQSLSETQTSDQNTQELPQE
jgi:hypothetical protein